MNSLKAKGCIFAKVTIAKYRYLNGMVLVKIKMD